MALQAPNVGGKGKTELLESVFGLEPRESLLHEMVRAEQASRRQGTHATKTRGQVAGGRAKPFRQKGTGRARQGTTRSAQHAGGGVVFGPQPRSYSVKVNRKAYLKARKMALSLHASEGSIGVFNGAFDAPRTKDAITLMAKWREDRPLVVVIDDTEDAAAYSFRNLPKTVVLTVDEMGVEALLWARSLLVSATALERLHWVLGDRTSLAVAADEPTAEEPVGAEEDAS